MRLLKALLPALILKVKNLTVLMVGFYFYMIVGTFFSYIFRMVKLLSLRHVDLQLCELIDNLLTLSHSVNLTNSQFTVKFLHNCIKLNI